MARYHLSPKTGMPQKCSAAIACPYGSMLNHYDNKAKALQAQEKVNKLKFADGGLAQVHERETPVPGRPANAVYHPVEETAEVPKKEEEAPKPPKMTRSRALDNARRARAMAGNERGAFIRAYLKKITVAEQLALFDSYSEAPSRAVLNSDEIPLEDDLIVQEGIIYRVTGYSTLRNEIHVQPLVATKGRDALFPTGQVISNYVHAKDFRHRFLKQLTPEEIRERDARRKSFKVDAERIRQENLAALNEAERVTHDYLASPTITLEGVEGLVKEQNDKLGQLNDELVYHRRISGMNFVDKAANKLANEGKLPPQHIAILNSAGSSAYAVGDLRRELWDIPPELERENKAIAAEFEKDPEDPEEPKAPGFWRKLFNGNAEEEHTEEVQDYQEEKTRKAQLRDKFSKNTSLLTAYAAHSGGGSSKSPEAKLSYSYGAVAISAVRNIYNSERILSMEDNVELKRILESHLPEALNVAADNNLNSSDRQRLNGALSNMISRIEVIRERSGTLSQMESKKAIEFLEVKFGDHS